LEMQLARAAGHGHRHSFGRAASGDQASDGGGLRSRSLLLDEHNRSLDPKSAAQVSRLTQGFIERGRLTTLMVTHSMSKPWTSHKDGHDASGTDIDYISTKERIGLYRQTTFSISSPTFERKS